MRIVYDFGENDTHLLMEDVELQKRKDMIVKNSIRDSYCHFYVKPDMKALRARLREITKEELAKKQSKKIVVMNSSKNRFFQ